MAGAGDIATLCGTQRRQPLDRAHRERAIAELAVRQHGVLALGQLRAIGLSASGVRSRVAAGRLVSLHRGVYAAGPAALPPAGRWLAAVLAAGPGAALSHRSAAAALGLRPTARAAIDVTVPHRSGRARAGIALHRSPTLEPRDVTTADDVPCTTVARTLLDLADAADPRTLERVIDQAEVLRILDQDQVDDVLARATGRRGAALLRTTLKHHDPASTVTRSELEERFLALCTAAGVPRPRVNAGVALDDGATVEVDFLWPDRRLIAETDGHAVHGTRRAFERDRRRDRRLLLAGWRVVRFTWREVTQHHKEVMAALLELVALHPLSAGTIGDLPERWPSG